MNFSFKNLFHLVHKPKENFAMTETVTVPTDRLLEAREREREARHAFLDACFQIRAYESRHRSDRLKPIGFDDGNARTLVVPVNMMKGEDPKLRALHAEKRRTQEEFHQAEAALAAVKKELGLTR